MKTTDILESFPNNSFSIDGEPFTYDTNSNYGPSSENITVWDSHGDIASNIDIDHDEHTIEVLGRTPLDYTKYVNNGTTDYRSIAVDSLK